MDKYEFKDAHFNILEKKYMVYWYVVVDNFKKEIVTDKILIKWKRFQMN